MKNTDAEPPFETSELGTPLDYTHDVYRVYFEVPDKWGIARKIIANFLGSEKAATIVTLAHGYEAEMPIQCVPDIVRLLSSENIAVYQVVRYAKTSGVWS